MSDIQKIVGMFDDEDDNPIGIMDFLYLIRDCNIIYAEPVYTDTTLRRINENCFTIFFLNKSNFVHRINFYAEPSHKNKTEPRIDLNICTKHVSPQLLDNASVRRSAYDDLLPEYQARLQEHYQLLKLAQDREVNQNKKAPGAAG